MRVHIAQRLVRYVSRAMDRSYSAHEENDKDLEYRWRREFKYRERWVLPIALWLHREAASQQMAEECWWG